MAARFTAKDPTLIDGGQNNFYAYAANDPVNQYDITGEALDSVTSTCSRRLALCKAIAGAIAFEVAKAAAPKPVRCILEAFELAFGVKAATKLAVGAGKWFGRKLRSKLARGAGDPDGYFFVKHNSNGGRVFLSKGDINQTQFAPFVESAVARGDAVKILSGVHGYPNGTVSRATKFFNDDVADFGGLPGVSVFDVTQLSRSQLQNIVDGAGTIIGGFCNSGVCLPVPR